VSVMLLKTLVNFTTRSSFSFLKSSDRSFSAARLDSRDFNLSVDSCTSDSNLILPSSLSLVTPSREARSSRSCARKSWTSSVNNSFFPLVSARAFLVASRSELNPALFSRSAAKAGFSSSNSLSCLALAERSLS